MQDMLDGLTYLNVHTLNFGPGEIRGQIDDVPGSGSPGAAPVDVTGAATAGGTLRISCPSAGGQPWVLIGLALPPCQTLPINPPLACAPGPANLGIDLIIPPIAVMGSGTNVTIPATVAMIDITVQCLSINSPLCIELSRAARIAIRP